ncbi:capping protein inhibiting regulator of actin dynamics [Drosophila biarmipes]|uniref:capping protein inhibiting regulator of actin dynamics n=1 Tax=Drosophila biarmipes TaxID=125945 RepID=UPI0007E649BB|nr:capping protein inhibiting regulator of actin dynamics [Drosophila biarmipes]
MSDSKMENNWGDLGVQQLDGFASEMSEEDIFHTASEEFPGLQQRREQVEQILRRGSQILSQAQRNSKVLVENMLKNLKIGCEKPIFPPQVMAPKAYCFKDIYSSRKDRLIRECKEQERKLREFHSRPMPDFRHAHERQASKVVVHRITCPITPNVLKNSREMEARRRLKVEQLQKEREEESKLYRKQFLRAKPIPQSSRQPLKPSNRPSGVSQAKVKVEPFNLSAESRVQQRRLFNVQNSKAQESKRREQEEQRQRAEREAYQKQRQLTMFRARPSPFSAR